MRMPLQLQILWSIQPWHVVLSSLLELEQLLFLRLLSPVCRWDFLAVERKDNIVYFLHFMLKLSCENKSAAATIHVHARSNDSPCTWAYFPVKNGSYFEDQKVHLIAALLIIFVSWCLFISSKRSDHDYLVKQNCVVYNTKLCRLEYEKNPAQMLEVASDFRRAPA